MLKSPKVRGGLGETLLGELLAQMLPREHYALQHGFASGEKVDAAVRVGGRAGAGGRQVPPRELPARSWRRPTRSGAAPCRRAFVRDVKDRVDEIAKQVHPARRGHVRLRPDVHAGRERLLRDHHQGRGRRRSPPPPTRWSGGSSRYRPTAFYAYLQVIVLGLRGLRIERDAQEIQARLGPAAGRPRQVPRVLRHARRATSPMPGRSTTTRAPGWGGSRTSSRGSARRRPGRAARNRRVIRALDRPRGPVGNNRLWYYRG